jgi:hypothetical protein
MISDVLLEGLGELGPRLGDPGHLHDVVAKLLFQLGMIDRLDPVCGPPSGDDEASHQERNDPHFDHPGPDRQP